MNFLTDQEREQLKLQHRRERDGRIRDRIKAVLLHDEGWTPKDIARVLLISDEAVRNHIDEYKASKKLKPESGGSAEKLSEDKSQRLEIHLHTYTGTHLTSVTRCTLMGTPLYTHTYTDYDLSDNLLTSQLIGSLGTIKFHVDPLSRTTQIDSTFFQQQLTLDPIGNIEHMSIQQDTTTYTYDELYQLTSETGPFSHTYVYDSLFNRLQKDNEPYQVNDLNQATSHLIYNKNGNPIRQGDTTYTYDALDRLIRIETPTQTQTYTYDSLHRRLSQTTNGVTIYFLYDGQNEIGTFSTHIEQLRILGSTPHAEIGASIALELDGHTYAPIHDLQGNIALLLPLDASEPSAYRYSAFGEELLSGPAVSPWRFASKRTDLNLVCFGRRFYVPTLGRWLTPDPAGFTDGMNLYAYVHNSPLTHFDEYGLVMSSHSSYTFGSVLPRSFQVGQIPMMGWNPFASSEPMRDCYPHRAKISVLPPLNPDSKWSPIYYLCGIQNTPATTIGAAQTIRKVLGNDSNIIPVYTESSSLAKDLRSVRNYKKPNYDDPHIKEFAAMLTREILRREQEGNMGMMFLLGFSRGGGEDHILQQIHPALRQRIIALALGPIQIVPRDLAFKVINLVSQGDSACFQCNPGLRHQPETYQKYADIRFLEQQDGFDQLHEDHFIESKTYQDGIRKHFKPLYDEYGRPK